MNKNTLLIALGLCVLSATGCQKGEIQATSEVQLDSSTSSLNCKPGSGDLDLNNLQIQGETVAQVGEAASYKLNDQLGCDSAQKVTWKAMGSGVSTKTAPSVTSVFNKAGEYVVTAKVEDASTGDSEEVSIRTTVVSNEVVISGPQVGMVSSPLTYELAVPSSITLTSAVWNFGDGSATVSSLAPVQHAYEMAGAREITVVITDSNGVASTIGKTVTIATVQDGLECVSDASISGPTEVKVGVTTAMSVYLPSCLVGKIGAVLWTLGEGTTASGQTIQHAYNAVGTYEVTAALYIGASVDSWVTLKHVVKVVEASVEPDPEPTPTPNPDPNSCSVSGQTRESQGDLYSETMACGLDGTKVVSYRDLVKEECKLVGEVLLWQEVSREKQMTNEGSCSGQSCKLPDGSLLVDGGSKVLYSTTTPAGTCASVSAVRSCSNGSLTGSDSFDQLVCHNGCGDFGSHGTVKVGVVTGEVKVPLTCAYGEEGFFDTHTEVSDQTCTDGQISNSNTRTGELKTAGSCPVYNLAPTENYTACSADCGGTQTRIYACVDDKGVAVSDDRCKDKVAPVEERLCDGNPDAVRRQEVTTSEEEGNSSQLCPANQIGVITNVREVTTTKTYACIEHKVQLENETVVNGPWVTESYCRDYVARRCSHDSLSIADAHGRLDWMVKCQDQLPVVKEFLDKFDDVKARVGSGRNATDVGVDSSGRILYPTFMDRSTKPEKVWIAPKNKNAACVMPATAYIATVCVASCATPEQQILVEAKESKKMKYVPFVEALTQNYQAVATLQSAQSMGSKLVQKTKVDQWVTELVDSEHDILVFRMKSGNELKVTPNHPIVNADGFMTLASDFKQGESLVEVGGKLDQILSITPIKHFGKVYNVFPKSNAIHKNIVIINGYLNGSAYFQNEGAKDVNRALFRDKLTKGAVRK